MTLVHHPTRPDPVSAGDAEALIEEARRRGRRRRLIWLGVVLAAVLGAGVGFVSTQGGGGRHVKPPSSSGHGKGRPSASRASSGSQGPSVTLSSSDLFNEINLTQSGLLLSGETRSSAGLPSPICLSATVDPHSLAIGAAAEVDCKDPTPYGQSVGVVNTNIPDSNDATISIARSNPQTGVLSVGPIVMTYASYSDTRPVTAYGGGFLWIYDNSTIGASSSVNASSPGAAELLEVSESSGTVVDTIRMPVLYRPLMAANDMGLWIGNSVEGGTCEGCEAPDALYLVAPGSQSAQVAISDTSTITCWLVGSQDHLWAGLGSIKSGCGAQTVVRLDGTNFRPVFEVPFHGQGANFVIGDEADSLWTVEWSYQCNSPCRSPQEIVRIDPETGSQRVVDTLPPVPVPYSDSGGLGLTQDEAVIFAGSMYLLEPPYQLNGYLGYSTLVKVALH